MEDSGSLRVNYNNHIIITIIYIVKYIITLHIFQTAILMNSGD